MYPREVDAAVRFRVDEIWDSWQDVGGPRREKEGYFTDNRRGFLPLENGVNEMATLMKWCCPE